MDIQSLIIDESATLIEAMEQLNNNAKKILFVTRGNQLVAALTDGDIRRFILSKGNLKAHVSGFANYSPIFLYEDEKHRAKHMMADGEVEVIPIVTKNKNIISIVFKDNRSVKSRGSLSAPVVIMVGGMGTRLYPFTKVLPKPLIPIDDTPIAEHIMNRFYDEGSEQFYLVVNHKKNMIKAYFNEIDKGYSVDYVDEDKPLGTGGGLSLLKGQISETFFLSNCDILIDESYEKIYNFHKEKGNLITMVCSLKNIKIPYGVVEISKSGEIESMQEKPSFSFFTNTGLYVVEPKVIEQLEAGKIIAFPDIIENYRSIGERVGVFPISESSWMDMGQFDEMDKMRKKLEDEK